MSQTNSNWKKLTHFQPDYHPHYTILFQKESKSLIAVPHSIPIDIKTKSDYIIYKYVFSSNSWKQYDIEQLTESNEKRRIYPKAINKGYIYANTHKHEIAMITLINETNKYKIKIIRKMNKTKQYAYGKSIIIKDEYHYISRNHNKYNLNTQKFTINPIPTKGIYFPTTLLHVQRKLMSFVQNLQDNSYYCYEYDIKTNDSQYYPIKLPNNNYCISCTSILNGQMILISATNRSKHDQCKIYIYEVKTKIIKKSKIKFPSKYYQYIFAINDKKKNGLLTYGWINSQYRNTYIPTCLKALIQKFCVNEILHTINRDNKHYKIDVLEIINNC